MATAKLFVSVFISYWFIGNGDDACPLFSCFTGRSSSDITRCQEIFSDYYRCNLDKIRSENFCGCSEWLFKFAYSSATLDLDTCRTLKCSNDSLVENCHYWFYKFLFDRDDVAKAVQISDRCVRKMTEEGHSFHCYIPSHIIYEGDIMQPILTILDEAKSGCQFQEFVKCFDRLLKDYGYSDDCSESHLDRIPGCIDTLPQDLCRKSREIALLLVNEVRLPTYNMCHTEMHARQTYRNACQSK